MLHHHHHVFWWRFFPQKKLNQIYLSVLLRSIAVSLIGLFIPLYLYNEIGFTLQETLLFYLFYSAIFGITTPLAAKFSSKFGMKHCILLSTPIFLLSLVLLYLLTFFSIPYIIISTTFGFSLSFYWMGLHLVFHHDSDRKHRGEEFGKRRSISIIGTLIGPFVGGLLIKFIGFYIVFILSSVLLFISAMFLFLSKDNLVKYRFSYHYLLDKKHWQNSLFFVSRGTMVIANGVIWPLFIFMILNDYLVLGIVGSLLSGISAILVWITGKYSDRVDKRRIIHLTTGLESLSWFLRAAVSNVYHIFGITIFGAIIRGIFETPIGALEYDKAKGNITGYFVSREIYICLGRVLLLTFVLITNSLSGGLIFQGFMTLAALLF